MDITKKISILNTATLESLNESDRLQIIKHFTNTGLKILGADFGFTFWKRGDKEKKYRLIYKTPNTPYQPSLPRPRGYNFQVAKTKKPYLGLVKGKGFQHDRTPYMKSLIILPIHYQKFTYGNLVLCFKHNRSFSKEDKSLSIALGNALAQALTINRLYHNLQDIKHTLDYSPQPKIIFDPNTKKISYFNKSVVNQTGLSRVELTNARIEKIIHGSSHKIFNRRVNYIIDNKIPSSIFEINLHGPQNRRMPIEILLQYVNQPGSAPHLLAIIQDLKERKKSEEQIKHAAFHDTLTGLPNRFLFTQRFDALLRDSAQKNKKFAVIFLDLDRFKFINDTIGHLMGDALLKQVALRLKKSVKRQDTVSRLGGDEFVILLANLKSDQMPDLVAQRIHQAFQTSLQLSEKQEVYVNFCMGISTFPKDGLDAETLLKNADNALYWAKQQGGNNYQHYRPGMLILKPSHLEIEKDLRQAIKRNELRVHYQPVVDLKSGRVSRVEALVRWQHPTMGLVSPATFIPHAEASGLIVKLGEWVFEESCKQLRAWRQAKLNLTMSINISARELLQKNVIRNMQKLLAKSRLSPKNIILELTETFLIKNMEASTEILKEVRKLGFKTSLDDFGTGFASLNYLKRLPVDYIKIGQNFVDDCVTNPHDAGIIEAIIRVAHKLNKKVVAEGVEQKAQALFLKAHGCDMVQGNFYSPSLPASEITKTLKQKFK